jgi:large subunit ribosomal protein L17
MALKKKSHERRWLKRILIALAAAAVTTLLTRRKALAPSPASFDFQLPPSPPQPPAPQPNTAPPADAAVSAAPPSHTETDEPAADPTSEGFDTTTQEGPDEENGAVDLSEAGLDIDVELELDAESAPDLTSEGLDTAATTPAAALASGDGYVSMSGEEHDCPDGFPIKGNEKSHIYHMPGESSYQATIPEICFASEEAAEAMGYRPRKH